MSGAIWVSGRQISPRLAAIAELIRARFPIRPPARPIGQSVEGAGIGQIGIGYGSGWRQPSRTHVALIANGDDAAQVVGFGPGSIATPIPGRMTRLFIHYRFLDTHTRQLPNDSIPGKRRSELPVQLGGYLRAAILIGKLLETGNCRFCPRTRCVP